jgi:glutamine kinase
MIPMNFSFGTKAETLERLRPLVGLAMFCEQFVFSVAEWRSNRDEMIRRALVAMADGELVVRSSARHEDGHLSSLAGAFLSIIGVGHAPAAFADAVDRVIASYCAVDPADQILVQPKLHDIVIAGVVLTRELDTGAPYYVINYDDVTGRTDLVTGGAESKTILVHRARPDRLKSARMRTLIDAVAEIERATDSDELDIEFCINSADDHYILQVRPLATKRRWGRRRDDAVDRSIDSIRDELTLGFAPEPGLAGNTTIYGQMPDWNPAEMIGSIPRPLAYSLYGTLITDSIWAQARAQLGYRKLGQRPLMVSFCSQPYIDVRRSLNSFLPQGLDEGVANKLVSHQLRRLADHRELHDKIEFAIAMPSMDLGFEARVAELQDAGLDSSAVEHFRHTLAALTRCILVDGVTTMRLAAARIEALDRCRVERHGDSSLAALRGLVEECSQKGTLPFAVLARHGFVGMSYLKSLVVAGAIDERDVESFLESIHTVAADFVEDVAALSSGEIAREVFLERYGHLRPGTYDITSLRYDEMPEEFLGNAVQRRDLARGFELPGGKLQRVDALLAEAEAPLNARSLFEYIADAIRLRERAKFEFTRTVSEILNVVVHWGERMGLNRDDLSFLTLDQILADRDVTTLRTAVDCARETERVHRLVRLPHLIDSVHDIEVIRVPLGDPTYITRKSVIAPTRTLAIGEVAPIDGQIVLVERADPGFDWILSHDIVGLVTKFGGANSHMAIRCAEFGLPAAIGCGERLFETLARARVVELNCAAQTVRPATRM